jgi:hypothetical protein
VLQCWRHSFTSFIREVCIFVKPIHYMQLRGETVYAWVWRRIAEA